MQKMRHREGEEDGKESQQHIHPDHRHRREPQHAHAVQGGDGTGDVRASVEFPGQCIEGHAGQQEQNRIDAEADPFGAAPPYQGGYKVKDPVIKRRVDVLLQVMVHRVKTESVLVSHGEVCFHLCTGDRLVNEAAVFDVGKVWSIVAVG